MMGNYPAEKIGRRCCECGEKLMDIAVVRDIGEFGELIEVAKPYCSDACEQRNKKLQLGDEVEEFEDIYRAGAT